MKAPSPKHWTAKEFPLFLLLSAVVLYDTLPPLPPQTGTEYNHGTGREGEQGEIEEENTFSASPL